MAYQDAIETLQKQAEKKRLPQNRLAKRAGLSNSQISRIFSGESTASTDALIAIAEAVGYPPEAILRMAQRLPDRPGHDPWASMMEYKMTRIGPEMRRILENLADELSEDDREISDTKPRPRTA